jgi:hypothetical protein
VDDLKVGDIVGRKHRKHDRLGMVVDAEPFGPMDSQPFVTILWFASGTKMTGDTRLIEKVEVRGG